MPVAFPAGLYQINDRLRPTGGLRYTDDHKDFFVRAGAPAQPRSVGDRQLIWDSGLFADLSDTAIVYAKAAAMASGRSPPSRATSPMRTMCSG